jgi:anti-sigma regulatory factor (Ser/Thr protein kinase)
MYGFKATNVDFKCNETQYDFDKEFNYDENLHTDECGFHICLRLIDTFKYYSSHDLPL